MSSHCSHHGLNNFTLRDEVYLWTTLAQKFTVAEKTRYFDSSMPTEPQKVDFALKDQKRTFVLRLSDRCLYVNPYFFSTISEKFKQDYALINDEHGEIGYQQFSSQDMRPVLESVCPTVYSLYPLPVKIKELPLILPIADELQMLGLKKCCEKIIEENFSIFLKNTDALLTIFDLAYRFHLDWEIQAKLLHHLLIRKFPADFSQGAPLATVTGNLLMLAILRNHQRRFHHENPTCFLQTSVDHGVQCASCAENGGLQGPKSRKKNRSKTAQKNVILSHCESCAELFCNQCRSIPCKSKLKTFLSQYLLLTFS